MAKLTRRQSDIVAFIKEFSATKGYAPTLDEIGEGLLIESKSTVHTHLAKLRDKGIVAWNVGESRTLRIISEADSDA